MSPIETAVARDAPARTLVLGLTLGALVLALFLYFFHQIIAYPLVRSWLGWRFNAWPRFWLANAVFVVLLLGFGWAWREVKARIARARRPALTPSG